MSIKIYSGWRWRKELGLFEIVEKVQEIMTAEVRRILKKRIVAAKMDNKESKVQRYRIADLFAKIVILEGRSPSIPSLPINHVFFIKDAGEYYLMIPENGRHTYDAINKIPGIEDFCYWDNADAPIEIDFSAWELRGKFWEEYWKPESACVLFSVFDPQNPLNDVIEIIAPEVFDKEIDDSYWDEGRK